MAGRAFPVLYAHDVERVATFYVGLGFKEQVRLPGPEGPGYVGLRRGSTELAVVTVASPQQLLGVEVGAAPRGELFVYVDDVDRTVAELRDYGAVVLREPADMPWGERVGYVADPEGNRSRSPSDCLAEVGAAGAGEHRPAASRP